MLPVTSSCSSSSSSHPCAMQGMRGEGHPGESGHDRRTTLLCLHVLKWPARFSQGSTLGDHMLGAQIDDISFTLSDDEIENVGPVLSPAKGCFYACAWSAMLNVFRLTGNGAPLHVSAGRRLCNRDAIRLGLQSWNY